uniref:uncharacterized protein LOC101297417 n=1 Tax=Fragaria vesca subsp. vesca TaxID=101020 RepID=UPI0005C8F12C|nr:PREDICTED: uncharacterized protein LOC101297417 [Fragaria vesca subsp. vesca]
MRLRNTPSSAELKISGSGNEWIWINRGLRRDGDQFSFYDPFLLLVFRILECLKPIWFEETVGDCSKISVTGRCQPPSSLSLSLVNDIELIVLIVNQLSSNSCRARHHITKLHQTEVYSNLKRVP